MDFKYDVIVIGAGHAGCEAAAAAANLGSKTCLITMDMNKIGQMSCNPAVGGIAKGQIVREIDALGGQMGLVTDETAIQFRILNRSKGPAMWSPRAQCDRAKFIWSWRERLENTPNLHIWQDTVCELLVENGEVTGLVTVWGVTFKAKCIVLTAGTFLNGLMHVGRHQLPGGRMAEPASYQLTESIARHGITYGRMKTGTPVRIDARSVHDLPAGVRIGALKGVGNVVRPVRDREHAVAALGLERHAERFKQRHRILRAEAIERAVEKAPVARNVGKDGFHIAVVRYVAAAFAGDAQLLAEHFVRLEQHNMKPALRRRERAHGPGRTAADHDYISFQQSHTPRILSRRSPARGTSQTCAPDHAR